MLSSIARKIFGTANERYIRSLQPLVDKINALEESVSRLSDEELKGRTNWLRERVQGGESLDNVLPDAFATVREASRRALGMRHFDVQLTGGIVLHRGMISEMKTGEGKTLVCTLPAYLNALSGKGVHVVTVNDYLASRDAEWMGKLYRFLGLTVGVIMHEMDDEQRRAAYACDITYATNNELGFDYLRDNMKFNRESMVLRPFNYAIVDEVDSILIDEARTPLIISGPTEDNSELYIKMNTIIPKLGEKDYEKDEKQKTVTLTEDGVAHVESILEGEGMITPPASVYDLENVSLVHHLNQALRAHKMFTADVDYIVKEGRVVIIDEFTGRMMEGRRYSDGLHQALEAKEGVSIQNENQTLASITFQNYFRLYPKLSGMTGTAMTEAGEFADIYGLESIEIPTNVEVKRIDHDDEVYRTAEEKYRAIIMQIARCRMKEQPVLVGTVSIEKSEYLSKLLKDGKYFRGVAKWLQGQIKGLEALLEKTDSEKKKESIKQEIADLKELCNYIERAASDKEPIPHSVLNARYHEKEAHIIAQAGRPGAVMIATNMAGRGTDIVLGGNAEMRIEDETANMEEGVSKTAKIQEIQAEIAHAKKQALDAGGLYVIATERHESRRIDNQLRGRSGRQGDPGASKFFISLEDDLMRIFGSERIDGLLQKMGLKEGEAILHPWMTRAIEKAQHKVEGRNYDIRKNLLKYDNVMNDQRKVIYEQRIELMEAEDVSDTLEAMREEVIEEKVATCMPAKAYAHEWQTEDLEKDVFRIFGLHLPVREWAEEEGIADEEVKERLHKAVTELMQQKHEKYGDIFKVAEKRVLLQTLDHLWKDHLHTLDHLRQGIHLRGYGQKDPLNEYKQEAFNLFEQLLSQLRELVTQRVSHMEINIEPPPGWEKMQQAQKMQESRSDPALMGANKPGFLQPIPDEKGVIHNAAVDPEKRDPSNPATWGKVTRNEDCPCGSGKKFKHCHGVLV